MEPKLAIGTSAVIGLPVSLAGAISYAWEGRNVPLGHWMLGYINVPALYRFGCAKPADSAPCRDGCVPLPSRVLAGLFSLFLVLNGAHMLYSTLN